MSSGSVGLCISRTRTADRDVQRHHARQGDDRGQCWVGPAGAQQPANYLGAHASLPGQFGLGEPENLPPFIQSSDHAVDGRDP